MSDCNGYETNIGPYNPVASHNYVCHYCKKRWLGYDYFPLGHEAVICSCGRNMEYLSTGPLNVANFL